MKTKPIAPISERFTRDTGFTLTELIVVVAVVAILALVLPRSLAVMHTKSTGTSCLSNARQLIFAIQVYSADFSGALPPNPDDGNTTPGLNWCPGIAGRGGAQEFNPDILDDPSRSLLVPYGVNHLHFRCPADPRVGVYTGPKPELRGQRILSARTFSMNGAVGTDGYAAGGRAPFHGPWLNNSHTHQRSGPWQVYGNVADFVNPGPSQTFVLIDEDHRGLNDGHFALGMQVAEWLDLPGSYHNKSASVAFADGHTELHPWRDPRTTFTGSSFVRTQVPGSVDWLWLSSHTSARK